VNSGGTSGNTGDGGAATSATMSAPEGLLVYQGQLLVASAGGDVIRAVDLTTRIITRWAGTGASSSTGDGLHRLTATFNGPHALVRLPDDSVLVAQFSGCRIWRITADGVARQFAGTGGSCTSSGNGGSGLLAALWSPVAVVADNSTGSTVVYWTEYHGNRVRRAD
jgi:hypothetical protein